MFRPAKQSPMTGDNRRSRWIRHRVLPAQVALLGVVLAAWQWLPSLPGISASIGVLDPFIISSPIRVADQIWSLMSGAHHTPVVWPYLALTLWSTFAGTVAGTIVGTILALVLGSSPTALNILRPFIVALNATPRIAIIPVII